jgi:menaquinol-cytochrome c reductase iron-sulfur subunit
MSEAGNKYGISRRGFVAGMTAVIGGVITAVVGLPVIGYLLSPALKNDSTSADEWVPLGLIEDIPEGQPSLFTFTRTKQVGWEQTANSYGVYVVKSPSGAITAYSNVCTHLSCRVTWDEAQVEYICPCHDGHFAPDGAIVSGPQPRPLDKFEHKIEDGTLMVLVVES